jgi:monoamine oxidase
MDHPDVIVIGAGFAGVTAARELASAGTVVTLLEARDRLGGRTWTTSMGETTIELGGGWIHWRQPHIWAEVTRYGLAIAEDDWRHDAVLFGEPPQRHVADEAFATVRRLFELYARDAQPALPRPYDPMREAAAVRALDQKSMQARLDELSLGTADEQWLTGLLYEIAGSPLNEAGFLGVARWMALCEWNIDFWYDTNKVRPVGGTIAILRAMLRDGRVDVRLSSPVASVSQRDDGVRVDTTDGRQFFARAAVVAVPVNVWPHIEFTPTLPGTHSEAARAGVGKPHQDKVWIRAKGQKIGRIFAQLPLGRPLNFFWTYSVKDDTQLIIGINSSHDLDVHDGPAVARLMQAYVPEIEEVLDVRGHSWSNDEYSRGGNSCFRTADATQYLESLQRPWQRLAFASADIASGWVGYMDGAVESGLRAARQTVARLGLRDGEVAQ